MVSRILYHGVRRDGERLIGGWRRVILSHHGISLLLNVQVVSRILYYGVRRDGGGAVNRGLEKSYIVSPRHQSSAQCAGCEQDSLLWGTQGWGGGVNRGLEKSYIASPRHQLTAQCAGGEQDSLSQPAQ